jgi:lipoyltransferase/lipoate-protein ligase
MKIYSSLSFDPYVNLAIEDHLLRSAEIPKPFIFLYKNSPSVVWGRFQNPWLECNLAFLKEMNLLPVRRQSGGGCVYQDLGNLNFSIHHAENEIHKKENAELIKRSLNLCGLESVEINSRHDLVIRVGADETRKFSGSAYKQTKNASFHHGTLLFDSNLEHLDASLSSGIVAKNTKSISSVRSRVANLIEFNVSEQDFLSQLQIICEEPIRLIDSFEQSYLELLRSDEWIWRETPEFTFMYKNIEVVAHKGRVLRVASDELSHLVGSNLPLDLASLDL